MTITAAQPTQLPTMDKLPFVDPQRLSTWTNWLLMGPYGGGKTVLAGSIAECPGVKGVLYIDVDHGAKSIASLLQEQQRKVKVVYIDDVYKDMNFWFRYTRRVTDPQTVLGPEYFVYDTVVIDSVTDLADILTKRLVGNDAPLENGLPVIQPEIKHWNLQKMQIEGWINQFKNLPCHLVVTCREHKTQDEVTKKWLYQAMLPGKLARNLPSLFDEVLWVSMNEKGIPVLQCKSYDLKEARDRSRCLPTWVEDPTFTKIFDFMKLT